MPWRGSSGTRGTGVSWPRAEARKGRNRPRRELMRRLTLLGAWMLAQREKLEELRDQVASELAGFLHQGEMAERSKALLTDVLGKWPGAAPAPRGRHCGIAARNGMRGRARQLICLNSYLISWMSSCRRLRDPFSSARLASWQ